MFATAPWQLGGRMGIKRNGYVTACTTEMAAHHHLTDAAARWTRVVRTEQRYRFLPLGMLA